MSEPSELAEARRLLARAEAALWTPDGLAALEEGLARLEDAMTLEAAEHATAEHATAEHATVARNLAGAYLARLYARIAEKATDPALPEPECEHLFRTLVAFDASSAPLPDGVDTIKIALARRLIDRYYEGHSAEAKAEALEQLTSLAARARR